MITPVNRITSMLQTRNENRPSSSDSDIQNIQSSIANSVEELAMSRTLYQQKDKKHLANDLGRLLAGASEIQDVFSEVTGTKKITKDHIFKMLGQLKDDVSRYQMLKFLQENADLDLILLQLINNELDKIRKKRKKIVSLDLISSETADIQQFESIDALMFQRLYLNFLEFEGPVITYYETLYRSSIKYRKIAKFISQMINYEIFGITPNDDIDLYIYMNEKRKLLNIINVVYNYFEEEKERNRKLNKNDDHDLSFINAILLNVDLDLFCSKMSTSKVSMLITYFNRLPIELFYSPEDKEDALSIMRNNVSHRFINNGLK